jgi:3-deoxy-manno-octulosonate cytidylyltransferase (CMP-KDO synthetase)
LRAIAIIPARFQSTRFPGKPLVEINGKTMIQRVYEQCLKVKSLSDVYVATDDERIANCVVSFGGKFVLTSSDHENGTERCNEAANILSNQIDFEFVINVQGDEPFINPQLIDDIANSLNPSVQIVTAIKESNQIESILNTNIVKVVKNINNEALYFSRLPIPYFRNENSDLKINLEIPYFKHIGIYAFNKTVLNNLVELKISNLENTEKLEQLRWLENGFVIKVLETDFESIGIDTPEDLKKIL